MVNQPDDPSAPLSVEQHNARHEAESFITHVAWSSNSDDPVAVTSKAAGIMRRLLDERNELLAAAHAEGVRTGRRQALEEAAEIAANRSAYNLAVEIRQRATRGDEAHQETSLLSSITEAKKNL